MSIFDLFKNTKFINPSEYTINTKSGDSIFIKDDVAKSSEKLKKLCHIVCPEIEPSRKNLKIIVSSAKSLLDTTSRHADKFYEIAIKTDKVDVFFENIAVVEKDYDRMAEIEQYVYYGTSPSGIKKYNLDKRLQIEIRHLIDRAYKYAENSKNPAKEMENQIAIYHKYESVMDEKTMKKMYGKYKALKPKI